MWGEVGAEKTVTENHIPQEYLHEEPQVRGLGIARAVCPERQEEGYWNFSSAAKQTH